MKKLRLLFILLFSLLSLHSYAGVKVVKLACDLPGLKQELKDKKRECRGKKGSEKKECKKANKAEIKELKKKVRACKKETKGNKKGKKECFMYNAKKAKVKTKHKKSCKGKWSESLESAKDYAHKKCKKKKKYLWITKPDGKEYCMKDTKVMKDSLKSNGASKKEIRKCKRAVRKGRKKFPNATVNEAVEILKKNGCDLEKLSGKKLSK